MTMQEQIHSWLQGREDEFVEALAPLIAINSVTGEAMPGMPFGQGPAAALDEAMKLAERWGMITGTDEGYVGTADLNGNPDGLHILAHLDVVGAGDNWTTDPFTLVRRGDLIFGRGTDDDKGPSVMALLAMRCVKELGIPLSKNVKLILGTDEETGSRDIAHYYASHPFAPCSISPDTCFPVTNVEKARYAPAFGTTWQENTAPGALAEMHGGIRINVAPANCEARILGMTAAQAEAVLAEVAEKTGVQLEAEEKADGLHLTATGFQAHAAHPEMGRNAITAMLEVLAKLPLAEDDAARTVRQLHAMFPFGDHLGKDLGIAQEDAVSGPLTLTFSLLDLEPTGFTAQFDCRACISATPETTKAAVEKIMAGLGWQCSGSFTPGHYVDGDSDFIRTLLASYEAVTGRKGGCESTGGGTYVHEIPGGVAFGAGEHDFDPHVHGADERASLKLLMTAAEVYALVIAELCK